MGPNMYLYEKAREAHCQDLQREMEARRLLLHLPRYRRSTISSTVSKLGALLLKLVHAQRTRWSPESRAEVAIDQQVNYITEPLESARV